MRGNILALNAGSSTTKFGLYEVASQGLRPIWRGVLDLGAAPRLTAKAADGSVLFDRDLADRKLDEAGFDVLLSLIEEQLGNESLLAAGHRIVHGGRDFVRPTPLTPTNIDAIEKLTPLAPLHQPRSLKAVHAIAKLRPAMPQIGCFDTAFHQTLDATTARFALPRRYEERGVRRYGFHGLSYEYIAMCLREMSPGLASKRTVVAHLGNGASLCAMRDGKSVDTTMGFSALDGLVMGTRSGAIDPGVLLYLLMEDGLTPSDVEHLLYHEAGLLGVSGISGDMRALLASPDLRAREAVELFAFRAARETTALANTLGGLECLVFTAGIGERAAPIRSAICEQLRWLGVEIDPSANEADAEIVSGPGSAVEVRVIPTDEEIVVARHTHEILLRHGAAN